MSIPDIPLDVWILLHQKTDKRLSSSNEAQKTLFTTSSIITIMFRIAFLIASLCIFALLANALIIQLDNYFNKKKQSKK